MTAGCNIESIGVKLPSRSVSTADIISRLGLTSPIRLELITGIARRRVCGDNEDSLTLARDAARDCFLHSRFKPEEIEMMISCSISKYVNGLNHFYEPPLSALLKKEIGCLRAFGFDISNACAGMITGIHIANTFISGGIVSNCLVVSGEYITSISNNAERTVDAPGHPEIASLTVGDAGAAVILTRTGKEKERIHYSELITLSRYSDLCTGKQDPVFAGATMRTQMQKIHEVSILHAPLLVEEALKKTGWTLKGIDYLIPHQTAKLSIEAGAQSFTRYFGALPGEILVNLKENGNTASTTHFVTLYKKLQESRFKVGDRIMLLSFASGLVIGILLFTINGLIQNYGDGH